MICSFVIPSRLRPERLMCCVKSIIECADEDDYEILVRIDDDDKDSLAIVPELSDLGVRVFAGPRLGYSKLESGYYTELANRAKGTWVWLFNDDMEMLCEGGAGWDTLLRDVKVPGYFVEPGIHGLGKSRYHKDPRSGSPCFVRNCWLVAGWDHVPFQADYKLTAKLEEMGWSAWFLAGICVVHDRDEIEMKKINPERKL